ncbi:MAG: 6-carboxytetrahydropterin synthase [Proteobacteria bacterium]|nr:6-carboxytetrahydropterin synthase [Pseudomonadota bacterium]
MFSVSVRDHILIAHSLKGPAFGPARRLHGATFVVEAEFRAPALDADGIVIDIGRARGLLRAVLDGLDYRNLDELPEFAGRNTTAETLAEAIGERLKARLLPAGFGGGTGRRGLRVALTESPAASAAYEIEIG